MKKIIFLMLSLVMANLLQSCSKENDYEYEITYHATLSEIQGVWRNSRNAFYTDIYIDGNTYHLEVTNAFNTTPFQEEDGDFLFDEDVMTLYPYEGTSDYNQFTVYWTDEKHSTLRIMPFGDFSPYTPPTPTPEEPEEPEAEE